MILTKEQLHQTFGKESYECELTKQKFGYAFFKNDVKPTGNMITFVSPCKIGPLRFTNSLVFCAELLDTDLFGGVCFQRLFTTQLASLLFAFLDQDITVDQGTIFLENKQACLSTVNRVKEDITFHAIFPLETEIDQLYTLRLDEEKLIKFQEQALDYFYRLTNSIFLETQRDNI